MSKFREFVAEHKIWFKGERHETNESLDLVESELGLKLPDDVRWLLIEYGYWHGTGISNISESIEDTKMAREHAQLPNRYLVIYDHQDAGVILLDTEKDKYSGGHRVIDSAWDSVPNDLDSENTYSDLVAYATYVISVETEVLGAEDIEFKDRKST